jgi:transcription antitermination factor NusG
MRENPWHVLHVLTNQEKKVAKHLTIRSLENYLPLYSDRSRWSDRIVTLARPLFPGYVFVRFAPEARILVISTPGILHLLGEGGRDTVSSLEIDRIREGLEHGCQLRPHSSVPLGSLVRVHRGVFAGAEGIVKDFHQQCKVIMMLSATRQCFSLELDVTDIEVVRKPAAGEVRAVIGNWSQAGLSDARD